MKPIVEFDPQWLSRALGSVGDSIVVAAARRSMRATAVQVPELIGEHRGKTATLRTLRWHDAKGATLTSAMMTLDQEIVAVTAVGLPSADNAIPILGIDIVGFGGSVSLVAADIVASHHEGVSAAMQSLAQASIGLPLRKLPEFAQAVFSKEALVAGAPGELGLVACGAVGQLIAAWSLLAPDDPQRMVALALPWCRAQRENRREQKALGAIFGHEIIEQYMSTVMFPNPLESA
jgi:hypothetical protein